MLNASGVDFATLAKVSSPAATNASAALGPAPSIFLRSSAFAAGALTLGAAGAAFSTFAGAGFAFGSAFAFAGAAFLDLSVVSHH